MSPLERRYRRLLALLPADHRAARGEELLGLLLDLDGDRTRPSLRQASGLIGLAVSLRLSRLRPARLAGGGSLLLAAFLVAMCTQPLGELVDDYTGAMLPADLHSMRYVPEMIVLDAVWLGVTAAWILGARRTAAFGYATLFAYELVPLFLHPHAEPPLVALWLTLPWIAILTSMLAALRWNWPVARPCGLLLATLPLGVLLWKLIGAWGRHGMYFPTLDPRLPWATAATGAVAGLLLTRGRRWPLMLLGTVAGLCAGHQVPAVVLDLAYGRHSWLLSIAVVTALLAVAGRAVQVRMLPRLAGRTPLGGDRSRG